ncbi:MAG TPA: alkaline phosphatase family protein, partial [Thermoanaerobaculia bacterium]|nr:alkaline phosphatase family protein [Thermoanaerobaculia bacterium]
MPIRRRAPLLALLAAGLLVLAAAGFFLLRPRGPAPLARRPVLFVGWDGADWQLLDDYLAAGQMPNLASLIREGRSGILTTIHPPLSPLVWTTMMTGVGPLDHGILDFTRFNPQTGAREPITSAERRAPAIWTMASSAGRTVAVLGLWATWPAEPVAGLLVSDRLFSFQYGETAPPPGAVYPPAEEGWARAGLTAAENRVDWQALRAYLPWLDEAAYRRLLSARDPYAQPASALRRILVETAVYHRLATGWLGRHQPDLAIVYFQGSDAVGHVFAPYAPPRQPSIAAADFARYSGVPRAYFAELDRLLGEYRRIAARSGAVLLLASDHGFRWKEGRPEQLA